jgi:basic membrane lipoprotein Med (substrate-binding protein (PBP1-ABC) superfamily)
MNRQTGRFLAGLCALGMTAVIAAPAGAQTSEVQEKPPLYSYISNWDIPRAQWADMAKADDADRVVLEKALTSGTIVGYGSDVNLIHTLDGETHDQWWSATSMAGVMSVLDQFYSSGSTNSPVLASATKHWDELYVSRFYNWHSGSVKNGYTHASFYKLKPDASDDAVEMVSKSLVVPLLEKQLAAGTIAEYEVDEEAIHTEAPGSFLIVYLATNAEALDKVQAAVEEAIKSNPLGGVAFSSMTDISAHRDELVRTNATYK